MPQMCYAGVHILDISIAADKEYDYFIPEMMRGEAGRGCYVSVPFGGGNRKATGLITSLKSQPGVPNVKPLDGLYPRRYSLDEIRVGLVEYIAEKCFCAMGDAARLLLPSGTAARGGGLDGDGDKTRRYASLALDPEQAAELISFSSKALSAKQQSVVKLLLDNPSMSAEEICAGLHITSGVLKTLQKRNVIRLYEQREYRIPYESNEQGQNFTLTDEQSGASEKLIRMYRSHKACAALLHGVTGSGKTLVMKSVIDEVIRDGRQVLLLLPEIALTPQAIKIFGGFYGHRIALLHSALSTGERFDAWGRIKDGEIDLVIGTRSALFAPMKNPGLIIIDEEQEHTYKSDSSPRYHARDIARYICAKHSAMLLLASATPSVESYYRATQGKYTLVSLNNRYTGAPLPKVIFADLRDADPTERSVLTDTLSGEMTLNLASGEQTIIFYNRRGYHNFLNCRSCGHVIMCPSCSVSLKLHSDDSFTGAGGRRRVPRRLICHYCGYTLPVPEKCPECGSVHLHPYGFGTQKCEDDIALAFPDAVITRMDADSTGTKFSHDRIIDDMKSEKTDILIGTQMVTKGHDFSNVTLVGVLGAELSLYLDDYRANERTFSLITQVVGRAGRADKPGRAVIQTFNPDNEILALAARQDYEGFYTQEIKLRHATLFPPFCDVCMASFSSSDEDSATQCAADFGKRLEALLAQGNKDTRMILFGPFQATVYKVNDKFRIKYILKCRDNKPTRVLLRKLLCEVSKDWGKVSVALDMNPNTI